MTVPLADAAAEAVTVAVLCRSDEPALARTLWSLCAAAERLAAQGRAVRYAICVNGPGEGRALAAARAFVGRQGPDRVRLVVDQRPDKARAWNLVRAACTTPLLALCDADVDVAADALLLLVCELERDPRVALASARQVPILATRSGEGAEQRASLVARAAALPYRFDFQVVGGRLYVMRTAAVESMPEALLLEDGWLSARLGNDALRTVHAAEVYFHPPATLADYFRERVRTEAGKIQIRAQRAGEGRAQEPIARYRWRDVPRAIDARELPLVALNLGVRLVARAVAEVAARRGREVRWSPVVSSKPQPTEVP